MVTLRKAADRGHVNIGWLDSHHTFSFGDYFDRAHMGFGPIRVINDDRIAGGGAFPMHPHADMEIVTYVLSGALEHQDSLGNGSVIRPGDVQRMSAGTGIRHSEANASQDDPVHLLQIWLKPDQRGLAPGYEQTTIPADEKHGRLRLIGSRDGREGSVTIHQDVALYASILGTGEEVAHKLASNRAAWVQVATGAAVVNGEKVETGDGVAITDTGVVSINGRDAGTELLLFDMAI
jgi:quercetin 2,3-dioxygenase